jgi:hypothetical protein
VCEDEVKQQQVAVKTLNHQQKTKMKQSQWAHGTELAQSIPEAGMAPRLAMNQQ